MRVKTQRGGGKKGGPRKVPRTPPLKHTTDYNINVVSRHFAPRVDAATV